MILIDFQANKMRVGSAVSFFDIQPSRGHEDATLIRSEGDKGFIKFKGGSQRPIEQEELTAYLSQYNDEKARIDQEAAAEAQKAAAEYPLKALDIVDQMAETERQKFITSSPGQAMTYQQKEAEARAFSQDSSPSADKYPMIYGEVGITASTVQEVVATILQNARAWAIIGAKIDAMRLEAKKRIRSAASNEAIERIIEDLDFSEASQ